MTPANRSDAFSEHTEYLARKSLTKQPETLERQYIRALGAITNGRRKLSEIREAFPDIDLGDEEIIKTYKTMAGLDGTPKVRWEVRYARYALELNYLNDLLELEETCSIPSADLRKRTSSTIAIQRKMEKEHKIPKNFRSFVTDDEAQMLWVEELTAELRTATATEQYSKVLLFDHGHSKNANEQTRQSFLILLYHSWPEACCSRLVDASKGIRLGSLQATILQFSTETFRSAFHRLRPERPHGRES